MAKKNQEPAHSILVFFVRPRPWPCNVCEVLASTLTLVVKVLALTLALQFPASITSLLMTSERVVDLFRQSDTTQHN